MAEVVCEARQVYAQHVFRTHAQGRVAQGELNEKGPSEMCDAQAVLEATARRAWEYVLRTA